MHLNNLGKTIFFKSRFVCYVCCKTSFEGILVKWGEELISFWVSSMDALFKFFFGDSYVDL